MIDSQTGLQAIELNSGSNDVLISQTVNFDVTQNGQTPSITFELVSEASGDVIIDNAAASYSVSGSVSTLSYPSMPDTAQLYGRHRAQFNVALPDGTRHTTDQFLIVFNHI